MSWLRGRLPTLRPARSLDRTRHPVPRGQPAVSRVVNEHNIGCMIIYWIWLKSYLHTT